MEKNRVSVLLKLGSGVETLFSNDMFKHKMMQPVHQSISKLPTPKWVSSSGRSKLLTFTVRLPNGAKAPNDQIINTVIVLFQKCIQAK